MRIALQPDDHGEARRHDHPQQHFMQGQRIQT